MLGAVLWIVKTDPTVSNVHCLDNMVSLLNTPKALVSKAQSLADGAVQGRPDRELQASPEDLSPVLHPLSTLRYHKVEPSGVDREAVG